MIQMHYMQSMCTFSNLFLESNQSTLTENAGIFRLLLDALYYI